MLQPDDTMSWDDYFGLMCRLVAQKSKDPNTKVGSVLVDKRNCVIGVGFNGPPIGCSDNDIPWDRAGDLANSKYAYVSHSESNCIDFCDKTRLPGSKLYVSLAPCHECAKRIIQNQIAEVVFIDDPYHDTDSCKVSRWLLDQAGVSYRQLYTTKVLKIEDT